jgi:membrane fusion protein (multidrug efflux system)
MKLRTIVIILVIIGLLVLIKVMFLGKKESKRPGAGATPQPTAVTAFIVKPSKLDSRITATGTMLANESADLIPEVSGRIEKLYFTEGSSVSTGQLLVKIHDADLQAQIKKLDLQLKLAAERETRQKKLLAIGGISQEEYDMVLNQVYTQKADIEFLHSQIAKTEIRAPFNGTIGLKNVSSGGYVSPSVVIASIQQVDPLKIDFSIPEQYAGTVRIGDAVYFSVQGISEKLQGSVYAIEPRIDQNTRTLQVRALCPNPNKKIFPGSFARVELSLKEINDAMLIPTEALIPELKGQKVFISSGGKAQSRKVEIGTRTEKSVQVTEGLHFGDTVITTGIMQLKNDATVKIIEAK